MKGTNDMNSKRIVIIGVGKGISGGVARRFGKEGFEVVLVARSEDKLKGYAADLAEAGIEASYKVADCAKPETLQAAIAEIEAEGGASDALVYNTGITAPDPDEITNDYLMEHYQVDVASAVVAAQAVATDGFAEKRGCVIFTGGGFAATWAPIPPLTALCIDKAAMNGAAVCLNARYRDRGIFVGTILVSGVVDPQDERYSPDAIAEQYWDMYNERGECSVRY